MLGPQLSGQKYVVGELWIIVRRNAMDLST